MVDENTHIDPETLCTNHLNGEHNEIHKHRHSFVKKHDMSKRMQKNQIFPSKMKERHDLLATEIDRRARIRGYGGHNSPYEQPDVSYCYKKGDRCG